MKRERLEELREETAQYRAVADDRCMSTQYEDDILAMIDEAIARQSVTDEQIRTALDYVSDYKKEAMAYDISVGIFPPTSEEVRAWETIETALRQMLTEPCWYCKGIESHGIKSVKTVTDESDRELGAYDTPYNFCPNCGRKLVKHDG